MFHKIESLLFGATKDPRVLVLISLSALIKSDALYQESQPISVPSCILADDNQDKDMQPQTNNSVAKYSQIPSGIMYAWVSDRNMIPKLFKTSFAKAQELFTKSFKKVIKSKSDNLDNVNQYTSEDVKSLSCFIKQHPNYKFCLIDDTHHSNDVRSNVKLLCKNKRVTTTTCHDFERPMKKALQSEKTKLLVINSLGSKFDPHDDAYYVGSVLEDFSIYCKEYCKDKSLYYVFDCNPHHLVTSVLEDFENSNLISDNFLTNNSLGR